MMSWTQMGMKWSSSRRNDNDSSEDQSLDSMEKHEDANEKTGYNLRSNQERSYKHEYDLNVFDTIKRSDDHGGGGGGGGVGGHDDHHQWGFRGNWTNVHEKRSESLWGARICRSQERDATTTRQEGNAAGRPKRSVPIPKKEALGYLMFLKKKRCGAIKGRGCADGWKQRAYITKEESTSPTVSTEAVFLTAVVDAWENRKVAVLDVPGAFMQVDMDELVHVQFQGEMVHKLLEIDHDL